MVSDNEEETIYVRKKSRKALMIVDDPEDDEEQESNVVGDKGPGIDNNSDGSEGITSQISSTVSKVVSASNSSDEGNESGIESNKEKPSESKKKARRIVAMTDSDEESGDSESGKKEPLRSHKFDNDIYDAEDSSDGEDLKTNDQDVSLSSNEDSEAAKNPKLLADSDIYDAEGSSDEDSRVVGTEDNKMSEQSKQKSKKSSKSKKKGNNKDVPNSDEVHIEAQRMLRQSRVRLPYHTPRQRSLHQFLHRRSLPPLPLVRTSAQQIKHLWEQLEEKEKEAEILYKSESECEDELDGNSVEQLPPPEKQVTFEAVEIEQSDSVPVQQPEEEEAPSAQADTHSTENLDASNGGSDEKNEPPKAEEVEVVMPKIKPPPGEVIELFLEDEPKCGDTPVDSFIKRFTKHVAINSKVKEEKQVDISVLSAEYNSTGEVVKLCEETLSVKCGGGNNTGGGGARMAALKASLKQAMAQDRHQRLERNKMNYQLDEEKFEDEFNLDDEELELSDKEGSIKGNYKEDCDDNGAGSESDEEVEEDLENYPTKEKKKDEYSKMFLEDEAEESDAEEGDGDNDRVEEDGSDSSGKEGSGSEEDNDDDNGSGKDTDTVDSSVEQLTQVGSFKDSFFGSNKEKQSSWKEEDKLTPTEDELMALCSGKFASQPFKLTDLETENSQDFKLKFSEEPDSQDINRTVDSSRRIIDSSDDEEQSAEKTVKKRRKKLVFSDDEEDDVGNPSSGQDTEEEEVDAEGGEEEDLGEVDDLEGGGEEIVDEEYEEFMSKGKDFAAGFLDEQAELSGSEYEGSADEDEEGLDALEDTEEADREVIDQTKLKRDLGKLHIKEMLAEDTREIRLLKELLLEDGELHSDGPKRQRLYRWSNQQGDDFDKKWASINDVDDDKYKEEDGEEDEDEASWRKDRLHRQTFLQKNSSELDIDDDIEPKVVIGGRMAKRNSIGTTPAPTAAPKQITSSPDPKNPFTLRTKRGSFLSRGQQVLSRLATLTGGEGGVGSMIPGVKPTKRNMVFAVVSPPKKQYESTENETMGAKRRCSYEASTFNAVKKLKLSEMSTEEQCISVLERLRRSDIVT